MKRAAGLVFAAILAASEGVATSYYALEVHGGSRIYALDQPVRKGRVDGLSPVSRTAST